jgi:uncharacterized protein YijF (DUF1287 family)
MRTHRSIAWSVVLLLLLLSALACRQNSSAPPSARVRPIAPETSPTLKNVMEAALEQTKYTHYYDQSYTKISYPGGDVPPERGACTDVIVRAFRKGGVDLQKEVHEDMARNFSAYPTKWGLKSPDPNIDHRRVPNLRTYFERKGKSLAVTNKPGDYLPGDVVTWDLGGGMDHIGMVTNLWSDDSQNCLIVHNIGGGARVENVLFAWRITGHYRYF